MWDNVASPFESMILIPGLVKVLKNSYIISGKIMGKTVFQEICKNVHSSVDFLIF